jgi:hypothetical protein
MTSTRLFLTHQNTCFFVNFFTTNLRYSKSICNPFQLDVRLTITSLMPSKFWFQCDGGQKLELLIFNKEFTISTISSYISFNDSFFRVHLSETFSAVMQELSGSWRNPTLWVYLSRWSHLWQSTLHRFNPAWIQQHDPQTHHLEYHCLDKP